MKRFLTGMLAAMGLVLSAIAFPIQAQQLGGNFTEILPALSPDAPDKIEVIEFFSYACPHCNELNPSLTRWAARQSSDVTFRKVAVGFGNPFYQLTAKLFYSLEAIGELKRLDDSVFQAIHSKGVKLVDEKSVTGWVASQGVDAKEFGDTFNSFGVLNQIKRSDMLVKNANIRGVPALVVDGRYLIGGPNIKGNTDLLAIADQLIEKVRSERRLKK